LPNRQIHVYADWANMNKPHFRLWQDKAKKLTKEICKQVNKWRQFAKEFEINSNEQDRMSVAFRVAGEN
jgi:hypothetical protein